MHIVTPYRFPNVFRAFGTIDLLNGAVNCFEPAQTAYRIHYPDLNLARIDAALSTLTPEEFEIFCGEGEHDEVMALAAQRPDLMRANELLNAFFDGEL